MKSLLFKFLRYSGVALFFREVVQRKKVSILLFHDMDLESAKRNFAYLKRHYNIIALNDYLDAIKDNNYHSLPHKALVLTFDDGHASNYKLFPLVKELNIPVTLFLCSEIVGTNRHFWFRHNINSSTVAYLKGLSNNERLQALDKLGFCQTKNYDTCQALQDLEIEEMKEFFDLQSHTQFHPILPNCTEEEAFNEISKSKHDLENRYNLKIRSLSYPNGDYSERNIEMAKQTGYECGITVDAGYNGPDSDLFRLKRLSVNDARTLDELVVKASGCYILLKNLFHKPSIGLKK